MGAGAVVAVVVLAVVAAIGTVAVTRARRAFKRVAEGRAPAPDPGDVAFRAAVRLTSAALRELPTPTWRTVHEIGADRLTGAEHVAIGPAGAFAVVTSLDDLPAAGAPGTPDAATLARAAMTRGGLDDALGRVGLSSAGLVVVHWVSRDGGPPWVAGVHGVTHVDGHHLADWATATSEGAAALTHDQVDRAWQAVVTAIGRPDPLA